MQSFLTRRTLLKAAGATLGVSASQLGNSPRATGQASAPVVTRTDFVYGRVEGSALLANLAWPDGPGPRPAILSVHGGRWRAGNRTDASSIKVASWAEFGFFAMSIDYRLVGGSPAPAPYLDLRCAIRWLHAHADDYGVDPDRLYIIGQSAGGHMVSLAATLGDGGYPKMGGWERARSDVRAAISVAGAYDLNTLSWGNLWSPISGNVDEARREASPMTHVGSATEPMLVIPPTMIDRCQCNRPSISSRSSRPPMSATISRATPIVDTWVSPTRSSKKRVRSLPPLNPRNSRALHDHLQAAHIALGLLKGARHHRQR